MSKMDKHVQNLLNLFRRQGRLCNINVKEFVIPIFFKKGTFYFTNFLIGIQLIEKFNYNMKAAGTKFFWGHFCSKKLGFLKLIRFLSPVTQKNKLFLRNSLEK